MKTPKINICIECGGTGLLLCSELLKDNSGGFNYWNEQCTKCKGSGRTTTDIFDDEQKVIAYIPQKGTKENE